MQTPTCKMCSKKFDLDKNIPMILSNCGHTFCKACLKNSTPRLQNYCGQSSIDCILCKKSTIFNLSDLDNLPGSQLQASSNQVLQIPQNLLIVEQLKQSFVDLCSFNKNDDNLCSHINKQLFCLDQTCTKNNMLQCTPCFGRYHSSCDQTLTREKNKFSVDTSVLTNNLTKLFDAEKAIKNMKEKMRELEDVFAFVFRNYETIVSEFVQLTRDISKKSDFVFENKEFFEMNHDNARNSTDLDFFI